MKKNFFKKLSFVLALAMLVSVIAPATGAFAAAAPKLKGATKKYLHLGVDGKDEHDFNISGKQKGWTYEWTSANEKVATVNNVGLVKATGVGSTKVSVLIKDKDGKEVDTLKATVVVRDNIAELDIYLQGENQPAFDKLLVGKDYDFGRKFTTVSGSKTKTSGITRWTVDATDDKATIVEDTGLFNAKVAGEYTITARSFQSKEKYENWKKDNTLDVVTAKKEIKVVVSSYIDKVQQVDLNTVKVFFASAMDEAQVKANLSLYSVVASSKIKQILKSVKVEGNVATVEVYVSFAGNTVYSVEYVGMESVPFTGATTNVDDVVDMEITTLTENVDDYEGTALDVKLYNKDGVNITTSDLKNRVVYTVKSDMATYDSVNKKVTIWREGDTAEITATYHTYKYDEVGNEIGKIVKTATMVGVKNPPVAVAGLNAWTIVKKDAEPKFADAIQRVAVGDRDYRLFAEVKLSDDSKPNSYANAADFKFESTDVTSLFVDPSNGELYPIKTGVTNVLVKYKDAVVGVASVNVIDARVATQLKLTHGALVLSNSNVVNETLTVKIEVLDQYGDVMAVTNPDAALQNGNVVAGDILLGSVANNGNDAVATFAGANSPDGGSYYYKLSANGLSRYIVITVNKADTTTTSYKLNLSSTSVDTKIATGDTTKELTIKIYGYDKNGVANNVVPITAGTFDVEITGPAAADKIAANFDEATGKLSFVYVVSGEYKKLENGTYKVRLIETANGRVHDIQFFDVKDSQAAPAVKVEKLVSSQNTIVEAIKDCIKLGDNLDYEVTSDNYVAVGNGIFVKSIVYKETFGGTDYLRHEIPVNQSIQYNK